MVKKEEPDVINCSYQSFSSLGTSTQKWTQRCQIGQTIIFPTILSFWDIGWCHILKAKLHKSSRSTNKFLLICLFILNLRKILIVPNLIIFSHQLVQYFEMFSRGSQKVWYKKRRGLTLLSCWLPFYLSSFNSYVDGFVLKEKSVGLTWVDVVLLFGDPARREKLNGNKQIYL